MPRPIQQASRAILLLSSPFLFAAPATSVSAQGTVIEEGSVVTGPVETRNEPIRVGADAMIDGAVRTRNGPITIGAGSEVGAVSTRNGPVQIAAFVQVAGSIETRNGPIELGDGARVDGSVATRNGPVSLGANGRIHGSVDTRSGGVVARAGARIDGRVESRNGAVRLEHARVGRDVDVHRGDVHLRGASEIEGDLIVLMPEEPAWLSWIPFLGNRDPVVRVDTDARVGGRLIVDERAELEIAPGADVPEPQRHASREAWRGW